MNAGSGGSLLQGFWRWVFKVRIYRLGTIQTLYTHCLFLVPQGAPTFTRKPQILQKTSESGDPAIAFDIGFQADFEPQITWVNPKGKKMKESSRIKFSLAPEAPNTYVAQLELKVR